MTNVFIVGAGRGAKIVLDLLTPLSFVKVLGMADRNPDAETIEAAQRAGVPFLLTPPIETLKALGTIDVVFNLIEDPKITAALLKLSENRFDVATGEVTNLLIRTMVEAIEKNNLLKKHLEISLLIAQSKTVDQIFDTIVTGSMEITNMPVGSLVLFNQEKGAFTLLSQKGLPAGLNRNVTYPLRSGGLTQHILANNGPTVIPDLATETDIDCTTLLKEGIRSLIAIPLFAEKELLGILYHDDIHPRVYPLSLVDVLQQFATEAVIAIQKQKAIAQVRHLSSRDPLTGLYNRGQLGLQLKEILLMAEQNNEAIALLIAYIDRFKEMNERLGHQYGDQALKLMVETIQEEIEAGQEEKGTLLFRSGPDEIAIILLDTSHEAVARKAALIQKAVQNSSPPPSFPLEISLGAALYPTHGESVDQIISRASRALLIAKKTDEKICIGSTLPFADADRVGIKFELIVDMSKKQVIGYEALSLDLMGKLSVHELFEKYAKLGQLLEVKASCFVAQLNRAAELGLSRLFLNIDSAILKQCETVQKPDNLNVVLEISEAESLHDLESYLQITEQWKRKGFEFAFDDLGAGFISLPFISKLNPEYIKIDRSVILQAVASPKFKVFLSGLVAAMQKDRPQCVIAEGVENEEELQVTREMGIDLVQGFLLRDLGYLIPESKGLCTAQSL